MKHPGIDYCPCCGARLHTFDYLLGRTVEAECKQATDSSGCVLTWALYWRCLICNLKWRHGQTSGEGEGKQ
jgi:hypothetical protein